MEDLIIPDSKNVESGLGPHRPKVARTELLKSFSDMLPNLLEIVRNLDANKLYRIVGVPKDGRLYLDLEGNIKGVIYKGNKIWGHARLQPAQMEKLLQNASAIVTHHLLSEISSQLVDIQSEIEILKKDLINIQISEIGSGFKLLKQAKACQDRNNSNPLIREAIGCFTKGLEMCLTGLKMRISEAPEPETRFRDNWGQKSKPEVAKEKLTQAQEYLRWSLKALDGLCQCYRDLDEPLPGPRVVRDALEELDQPIEMAVKKSRLLEKEKNGKFPEEFWKHFLSNKARIEKQLEDCDSRSAKRIVVEFKPKELLELSDEYLS